MGTTENKAVSTRFIEEVFNKGQYDLINDLLAEDFVAYFGGSEQEPGRVHRDGSGLSQRLSRLPLRYR